jgi:hypothetical protein
VTKTPQFPRARNTLNLDQIRLRVLKTRMREKLGQIPVVCKEEQSFAFQIKASHWEEPLRNRHKIEPAWMTGSGIGV